MCTVYRPSSAGLPAASSLVATCQATCAQLLGTLGRIHTDAAGQALGNMMEACISPEATSPPEGLAELIAESLCGVAVVSRCLS